MFGDPQPTPTSRMRMCVCMCVIYRAYIHRVSHLSSADTSSRILTALSARRRPSRCNLKPARVRRTLKCLGQMKNGAARGVASPLRKIAVTFSKPISRRLYYFIYSSIYFSVIYIYIYIFLSTPVLLWLLPTPCHPDFTFASSDARTQISSCDTLYIRTHCIFYMYYICVYAMSCIGVHES